MGIQAQIYRSPLVGACTFLLLILSLFLCMCFHHLRLYTVSGLWLGVYSCSVCFHEKKCPPLMNASIVHVHGILYEV